VIILFITCLNDLDIIQFSKQRRRNEYESGGGTNPAQSAGNIFLVVNLHFFGSEKYN